MLPKFRLRWRRWLFLGGVLGLVGLGLFGRHVYEFARSPLGPGGDPVVQVPQGASYNGVVARLVEQGWLAADDTLEMKLLGRALGAGDRIRAGEYRLKPTMTPLVLLDHLVGGRVILHSVTLPEGWTVQSFLDRLGAKETLDGASLPEGPRDPELLQMLDLGEAGHDSAEGWLFPDTYRFPRGEEAAVVLRKSHQRMERILAEEWQQRAEDLPIDSAYEALVLASIVEKETAVPEERAMIAGVFMNRLRQGMRLQTDPTVIYGLGDRFDGNLRTRHLEQRTPYNTYRKAGLPPTPIANPGRKAIRAACQPADTDALYFVARGDGTHVFSETLAEHNRAVRRYQLGGN